MLQRISEYISKHRLLAENDKVLVALSGGADSVALLLILTQLGYRCSAIHCNFHLRAEESMRDEEFVRTLCKRIDTPLTIAEFDTAAYAAEKGISIEMAAREQRYEAFEKKREEEKASAIAVAHHRDDCAETLLLNLIRGTGIKGLHGIRPKNGHIIRPLLAVGRNDILNFLKSEGEEYVTDSTNLKSDFTRNKIRLEIIPLMKEINPSILQTLYDTANRMAEAEIIYEKGIKEAVERIRKGNTIDIQALKNEPAAATVLHEIVSPLGFNSTQTADILKSTDSAPGRKFTSTNREYVIIKDRTHFIIEQGTQSEVTRIVLPEEGEITTLNGTISIEKKPFDGNIPKSRDTATLDCDTLSMPLTLRNVLPGDRFIPFGMRGSKLVSDYLTDRKQSILKKRQQMVVADAHDNIVWLVGERPAAPYCITKKTKKTITLHWHRR